MKKLTVYIEWSTGATEETIDIEDDLTEDEIEAEAKEVFSNYCSYGYSVSDQQDIVCLGDNEEDEEDEPACMTATRTPKEQTK